MKINQICCGENSITKMSAKPLANQIQAESATPKEHQEIAAAKDVDSEHEEDVRFVYVRDHRTAPTYKLSVDLLNTYVKINQVYYAKKKKKQKDRSKDSEYDYHPNPGELLNGRYRVLNTIGKGSFGTVIRAYDVQDDRDVAIKVIKKKRPFLVQSETEIRLLRMLNERVGDNSNIVSLLEVFMHNEHRCLVFENLSKNLYELLRMTRFKGVSLNLVQEFGKQVLQVLKILSHPDVNIIHCDLKPENILLVSQRKSKIKVIDFGSSCLINERMYSYIQSRFYRSPEVILGLPYDTAIDMWSLGCILVEMHTGTPLFGGQDEREQIGKIVGMLGLPPTSMVLSGKNGSKYFRIGRENSDGSHEITLRDPIPRSLNLEDVIGVHTNGPGGRRTTPDHNPFRYQMFVDLIRRMLTFDPDERIKPQEALQHPFLSSEIEESEAAPRNWSHATHSGSQEVPHSAQNSENDTNRMSTTADPPYEQRYVSTRDDEMELGLSGCDPTHAV